MLQSNSVISLGNSCFKGCIALTSIIIPNSVTSLGNTCFQNCTALASVTISNGVTSLGNSCFSGCTALTSVTCNELIYTFDSAFFTDFTVLTTFNTLAGFNPTGLNLAASTLLSHDSILAMFNNLATLSTAKVLTLGATNLAKMTSGEKAIATNKKMDVSLNTHNLFRGRRRVMEHLTKEVFYTIGDINSYTLIADEDYIIVKISDSQVLSKQIYLGITDSETNYKAVLISDIPIEGVVINVL